MRTTIPTSPGRITLQACNSIPTTRRTTRTKVQCGLSRTWQDNQWHHARRISHLSGKKDDWIETRHRAQGARTCLLEKKSRVVSTMVINDN
jgi:hypothetical protein